MSSQYNKMSVRKSIVEIMVNENVSATSAILKKYPELGEYQALKPEEHDAELIDYLSNSKTPPLRLMEHICKQTGLDRLFIQRILAGDGTERAKNAMYKRQATLGGKDAVKARADKLQAYIDENLSHPDAPHYPMGTANTINTKLGLPDDSPSVRIANLISEKGITFNDFAWLMYDASSLRSTPEAGVRIVTRRILNNTFGEKHPVLVSFSECNKVKVSRKFEVINKDKLSKNVLLIEIPKAMTPAEYATSDVLLQCEQKLDEIYTALGYQSYRDYLENITLKKAKESEIKAKRKAFRKTANSEGLYAALKLNTASSEISTILDITNRHIKNRKTCSYLLAQQVYKVKCEILVGAVSAGDASVTRLVKRPNPFMLDEADMLPIDNVIRITEKIYSGEINSFFSIKNSISDMFAQFNQNNIVEINDGKIEVITDPLTYAATFVRYLLTINKQSMVAALSELFCNKTQVLDCFIDKYKKEKRCFTGTWLNMDKHFNEDYANVWEIAFNNEVFHLPYLNMPQWKDLGVDEFNIPYEKIGGRSVTNEENEKYPFNLCLERIGHFAQLNQLSSI